MKPQVMEGPLTLLRFVGIFIHYYRVLVSKELYLHQTFTDCVSNLCAHIGMSICQM